RQPAVGVRIPRFADWTLRSHGNPGRDRRPSGDRLATGESAAVSGTLNGRRPAAGHPRTTPTSNPLDRTLSEIQPKRELHLAVRPQAAGRAHRLPHPPDAGGGGRRGQTVT